MQACVRSLAFMFCYFCCIFLFVVVYIYTNLKFISETRKISELHARTQEVIHFQFKFCYCLFIVCLILSLINIFDLFGLKRSFQFSFYFEIVLV